MYGVLIVQRGETRVVSVHATLSSASMYVAEHRTFAGETMRWLQHIAESYDEHGVVTRYVEAGAVPGFRLADDGSRKLVPLKDDDDVLEQRLDKDHDAIF